MNFCYLHIVYLQNPINQNDIAPYKRRFYLGYTVLFIDWYFILLRSES